MKNICKSSEPTELKEYKERFSSQFRRWKDLKKNQKTLNAIRHTLEKVKIIALLNTLFLVINQRSKIIMISTGLTYWRFVFLLGAY